MMLTLFFLVGLFCGLIVFSALVYIIPLIRGCETPTRGELDRLDHLGHSLEEAAKQACGDLGLNWVDWRDQSLGVLQTLVIVALWQRSMNNR
jgi:hypothetical protein